MFEMKDGFVFVTFADGNVIWYRQSYRNHCLLHTAISDESGREEVQETLISPDYISEYFWKDSMGKISAKCKKYRRLTNKVNTTVRGKEWEYWEVIINKKRNDKRKRIATAYLTNSPNPSYIVNDRIEKVVYLSERIKKILK